MIRRILSWMARRGGREALQSALWFGGRSAVDSALGAAVPRPSQRTFTQVFNVTPPVTVYVRASHCRVTLRRASAHKVILEANLYRAFGVELAAEQDEAGVYIVARRKAVVGKVTRTDFTLTVPNDSHLAFHLTPGDVVLEDVDGLLELPVNGIFPTPDSRANSTE